MSTPIRSTCLSGWFVCVLLVCIAVPNAWSDTDKTDVDLERGLLRLVKTKNRQPRSVPLVGLALELLRAHAVTQRAGVDWLFPRADGQRPVLIEQAWRTARTRAGLVDFRFHDLRHTCASYLALNGATLLEIAEVLGHKKMDMTRRYAHLTDTHLRGVVDRMTRTVFGASEQEGALYGRH